MSFLFSFIVIILFFGLFIIIAVLGFLRSLFGFGKRKNPMQNEPSQGFEQPTTKHKIFDKKDGEYVDFEEVE